MTLELLFARQLQCITFLRMAALGLACGLLWQISGALRQRSVRLAAVWDAVCCAAAALMAAWVLARSGAGVRLYGVLGLLLGMSLYLSGVGRVLAWVNQKCSARRKTASHSRQTARTAFFPAKSAGESTAVENNTEYTENGKGA